MKRTITAAALAISIVFARVPAHAQPAAAEDASAKHATELKQQADDLMQSLRYAEALALYKQAYELSADPAILYNQGRALEALGDYPEALERLDAFKRVAPADVRAKIPDLDGLISEIAARVGKLVVRCTVPSARVTVRDRVVVNGCDGAPIGLRAGAVTVEVIADGYDPFTKTMAIAPGSTETVEVVLVERRTLAMVSIRTRPIGSLVTMDGKAVGPSPIDMKVAPGSHVLRVHHDGFVDKELPLSVEAGDRREVDVPLESPPALTSRWWFWTSIGCAIAGGAVLGLALSSEKGAPSGSFSPGQVRGP